VIKTYDFKSPKKFTKERMGMVENLYEGFSRSLATYLTGLLQVFCEIDVIKIEERRYGEFSGALSDESLFGLINLIPGIKDYNESPMVLQLDPAMGFFMIERVLGGSGTGYHLSRSFTDIEKAILEYLMKKITFFIQDAWCGYMDIKADLSGIETNAHLLQMSAPEDVVVVVEEEVHIQDFTARLQLVMPAANVEELTSKFGFRYAQQMRKQDEEKGQIRKGYITQHLLESEVELRAIIQEFQLSTQEILGLQVGDVVPLNKNINSNIDIVIDDMECFKAKIGRTKLRKAVQITKVL